MKYLLLLLLTAPGLGLFLSVGALYWWRRRPERARKVLVAAILLGWMMSTEAVGRFMSTALIAQVRGTSIENAKNVDLILVLSGGMEYVGKTGWIPTRDSYQRIMVGYQVQQNVGSRTPILISGGKTHGPRYPSEASVCRDTIDRNHAELTPIWLEESSLNTYESALESARIIREKNVRTVLLVTSEVHMLRALAAFRGRGIDPVPFPVFVLERGPLSVQDFLPSWRGVELTGKAVYEILGIAGYYASGYVRLEDIFYKA
ncbi:MAG: hypothetical protein GC134_01575 [Proteobacteria bacterium]|nr:hypothetical protein [Pseudomonadota bacterium]